MPVIPSNPQFGNQVGASPFSQAYSVQLNFGQMLREVTQWNPNVDSMMAGRFLNNYYRKIIDMRSWYGLKARLQISVPNIYQQGTCTTTYQSPVVTGVGTNWTPQLVGLQFRIGFTYPYQTILSVQSPTQLTLDQPFGGQPPTGNTITGGYLILQAWVPLGPNIKRLVWAVNQQQGWPMYVNVPQEVINSWDVWRTQIGWSTHISPMPPTTDGQYQVEIWPNPYANQVFPCQVYLQPPDMQLDTDSPVAWIRSDLLVTRAVADALMFRPKQNSYYDPQTALAIATQKKMEFNEAVEQMAQADNDMDQRDVSWDYGESEQSWLQPGWGSAYTQSHDA